ncbi:shootin-1-like isoform X2 [Watersipora subatra]|uniref:shootin-1-like isoform X2 n=1 Tax=Watersipora subatra TaxID=2589382 RepID=UPI00355C7D7E
MSTDKLFDDLTNVGKNALHDYDDLLHKYNRLVKDHEVIKGELDKLQNVAEPMFSEYGQMRTKYEMEVSLRSAAEVYANKVLNDNKKIKRQSAMIIAQMSTAQPIAVDIDIDDSSGTQDDRIEELGKTITKLQDEVARTKAELFEARDEINILHTQLDEVTMEREEYKMQCLVTEKELSSSTQAIKKHQRELKAINRASTLAVVDYSSLNDMYETEKALRIKAESYAGELQRKRTSLLESKQTPETESEAIIQLKEENDKLHTELTEQEMKYKVEMEGLEQQLKDSASHGTIENLEEKLDLVKDDIERLNDELDTQKKENEELRCKIVKMEKEKAAALNIPLPPPPPPPPGPAAGIGRLIISKKKKKEQKLERVVGAGNLYSVQYYLYVCVSLR